MNALPLAGQLPVLPIVVPLLMGGLLVVIARRTPRLAAPLGFASLLVVLACAAALCMQTAGGAVLAYLAGNWPAPFGISLAVDRLAAMMLLVTAVIAIACQLAAADGLSRRNPLFSALLLFQVAGLNGAFLTADLFNLFVFFEVLLAASYALLLAASDRGAVLAGIHYVAVNLLGSTLFLMAAALLYGVLGTLNMADLSLRAAAVPASDRPLVEAAGLMLLVAFGIKAAALPLGFWLPRTYGAAQPPVAALFAIMTKVGVYAIVRVGTLVFGAGGYSSAFGPVLMAAGIATLAFAAFAGLAARDLRSLAAWMICGSAGTLLLLVGLGTPGSLGAAMFYLPHATFSAAALMLLAGLLSSARGPRLADRFELGAPPEGATLLGTLFFVTALASAGLPPFSGFVAKAILLDSVAASLAGGAAIGVIWGVVLGASLAWMVALSRGGSLVFWKSVTVGAAHAGTVPDAGDDAAHRQRGHAAGPRAGSLSAIALLVAAGAVIVVAADPLARHFARAGAELAEPDGYRDAVLTHPPVQRVATGAVGSATVAAGAPAHGAAPAPAPGAIDGSGATDASGVPAASSGAPR
jgi:multicomponent K+:H+ antiporter subunit D